MTICSLQKSLVEALSACEALLQGGCRVFAEDTRTVYDLANQCIQEGNVAVVVVTPDFERAGSGIGDEGLPFEADIVIRCMERPPVAAAQGDVMRALDAAELVSHLLDGEILEWRSIRQTVDRREGVLTATATFGYDGVLTRPDCLDPAGSAPQN